MASAVQLTEPQVLAHTKDRLFRDSAESNTYTVCDTQFAMDEWISGQSITSEVRERLAPFNHVRVTPLGEEVVRFALERYGSVDAALRVFEDWQGSRTRFCELAPEWGLLARRVVWAYPATQLLVEELQTMHDDGIREPSLVDFVEWLHVQHPTFTVELFLRGTDDVRSRALDAEGNLQVNELEDGNVFHSPTVFQLKAMLYHARVLTDRGAEPHRLDPMSDVWQLREPLEFIP